MDFGLSAMALETIVASIPAKTSMKNHIGISWAS